MFLTIRNLVYKGVFFFIKGSKELLPHIERFRRRCNVSSHKKPCTGFILCAAIFFDSVVIDSLSNSRVPIRTLSKGSDRLYYRSPQISKKADLFTKNLKFSHILPSIRAPPGFIGTENENDQIKENQYV